MKVSINDINPSKKYDGYIWMSDRSRPYVLHGETLEAIISDCFESVNPFVVEGYLYNRENNVSYSIKQIDGEYWVIQSEVFTESTPDLNVEKIEYIPHRLPGVKKLQFLRYWRPYNDPLCLGMPVLQPAEMVFAGFINEGENNHD